MKSKQIALRISVAPTSIYFAFNMLDDTVGGYSEEKRKLRQAIAIALDFEEYIEIFLNGRGIPAHSPLPPGLFGYLEGEGRDKPLYIRLGSTGDTGRIANLLKEARRLLAEAGYPGGQDSKGNPLIISFDNTWTSAGASAALTWMRKKLERTRYHLGKPHHRLQPLSRQG